MVPSPKRTSPEPCSRIGHAPYDLSQWIGTGSPLNRMGCSVAVAVTVPSGLRAQEVEAGLLRDVQPDVGSCARWAETFPKSCTCPTA